MATFPHNSDVKWSRWKNCHVGLINPFRHRLKNLSWTAPTRSRWTARQVPGSLTRSAASHAALQTQPVSPWLAHTARSTDRAVIWLVCPGCGTASMICCESCRRTSLSFNYPAPHARRYPDRVPMLSATSKPRKSAHRPTS